MDQIIQFLGKGCAQVQGRRAPTSPLAGRVFWGLHQIQHSKSNPLTLKTLDQFLKIGERHLIDLTVHQS